MCVTMAGSDLWGWQLYQNEFGADHWFVYITSVAIKAQIYMWYRINEANAFDYFITADSQKKVIKWKRNCVAGISAIWACLSSLTVCSSFRLHEPCSSPARKPADISKRDQKYQPTNLSWIYQLEWWWRKIPIVERTGDSNTGFEEIARCYRTGLIKEKVVISNHMLKVARFW